MNAAFYSPTPQAVAAPGERPTAGRARRVHRWIATVFTLSVALNFAVMPWGPPPAWITFAPLPPLLLLMATGLAMLVAPWLGARGVRGEAR